MIQKIILITLLTLGLISCGGDIEVANETPEAQVGCTTDHPSVGKTGTFSNLQHDVGGVATIISDCEIEITNFSFDGGGSGVHVYAAEDQNSFSDGYSLSDDLRMYGGNGDPNFRETFSVFLPEGVDMANINSLSIWCVPFGANFGFLNFN